MTVAHFQSAQRIRNILCHKNGVPVTLANTLAIAGGDMLSFTMMLRVHGWSKLFDDLAAGLDDKKSDSIGRWRLLSGK